MSVMLVLVMKKDYCQEESENDRKERKKDNDRRDKRREESEAQLKVVVVDLVVSEVQEEVELVLEISRI